MKKLFVTIKHIDFKRAARELYVENDSITNTLHIAMSIFGTLAVMSLIGIGAAISISDTVTVASAW